MGDGAMCHYCRKYKCECIEEDLRDRAADLSKRLEQAETLLKQATDSVCSLQCPSHQQTGSRPPHSPLHQKILEYFNAKVSQ